MVERASGRSPDVVCGKPSGMMFDVARERFGVDAHRTLMVGDRSDLVLCARFGFMCTILFFKLQILR